MKHVTPSSGKVVFVLLIVVVVVLGFAAGVGFYFKKTGLSSKLAPQPVMTRHKILSTPAPPEGGGGGVKTELPNPGTQAAPPVASQVLDEAGPAAGETDVSQAKPSALDSDGAIDANVLDEKIAVVSTAVESENPEVPAAEASPAAEFENPSIPVVDAPTPPLVDEKPSPQLSEPEPSLAAEVEIPKSATVDSFPMEETDVFAIQVGAYRSKDNASQKVAVLQKKGYDAFIVETGNAGSKPWYMVRFGRYASKALAQAALIGYKQTEKAPAIIMRLDRN